MAEVAITGLGTMGSNLARNFARNGYKTIVHNRTYSKTEALVKLDTNPNLIPVKTPEEVMKGLRTPRVVILMVTDTFVDQVLDQYLQIAEKGDILIDGGNSYWKKTEERQARVNASGRGVHFIGMGVSGGEEGALNGPSIMFGGDKCCWDRCKEMLSKVAAKAEDGAPCVDFMGTGGAGHFVKMVHNAIEYADMQLIVEVADIMHTHLKMSFDEMSKVFEKWNQGVLKSYLIEITYKVLRKKEGNKNLVELILDKAGQKGTGRWAAQDSYDFGAPCPAFGEAVDARIVSSLKDQRVIASKQLAALKKKTVDCPFKITVEDLEAALYAAKIMCYAQGLALIQKASADNKYGVDIKACARIWRGGCIIRADFLNIITARYNNDTKNLMCIEHFSKALESRLAQWRKVLAATTCTGIPSPLIASTLAYFDSYTSERLPAYLIQGLRDFFGAHTYERTDKEGSFHTQWE